MSRKLTISQYCSNGVPLSPFYVHRRPLNKLNTLGNLRLEKSGFFEKRPNKERTSLRGFVPVQG